MGHRDKILQISVVGGSNPDAETLALAEAVGKVIAARGAVLICGGLGGVMEAASRGAKEKDGLTVGIIPTYRKDTANPFIDITVPTGLGHARNVLVAAAGDLLVALAGSHGTRSEVATALILGKRVVGIKAWGDIDGVTAVNNIEELEKALVPNI